MTIERTSLRLLESVLAAVVVSASAVAANISSTEPAPTAASAAERPPMRHGVFRFTSYPAAWTASQKTNRPILVFATAPGCPHCVKMIGDTYKSPAVKGLVCQSFESVYVDRVEQPELAAKLKVRWFPTTIVVGPNNKVIDVIEGYVDPKTFAQRLQTTVAAEATATQKR